jgi:hypothetical protein
MSVHVRRLLQGMGLLTVVALVGKLVSLAAPMPVIQAPTALQWPGYTITGLEAGAQPRRGRELSHGTQRVFRLEPRSGESPLTLRLMPVRSRRGSEISEQTDANQGLNMGAVAVLVPSFALKDSRILSVGPPQPRGVQPKGDQIALGRSPADPPGSITRLQTCLSPTGLAGLSSTILVPESHKLDRMVDPHWTRHLRRMAGLSDLRYECLAVQLESAEGARWNRRKPLERAWKDLREALMIRPQ